MSTTRTRGILTAAAAIVLAASAIGGTAAAQAAGNNGQQGAAAGFRQPRRNGTRPWQTPSTASTGTPTWQQTSKLKLNFPTFHTEGIAYSQDHIFLSAVQIIEPTVKFPTPQNGFDRTPGKGIGHLFVMDKAGNLQKDIILGEGDMYHPGGIDFDGTNVWVPVAQYRPNSSAIIYRVDANTLDVHKQFEVKDHFGGIVMDKQTGHLVGNTWGSRRFAEWDLQGKQLSTWENPNYFIDYQDCQYVPNSKMLCGGITNLPQTPAAGGTGATYELGGMAMIDLKSRSVIRDVPFQQWSTAGHVATRNPFKMTADGEPPHHEGGPRQRRRRQRHRDPHLRGHRHARQVTAATKHHSECRHQPPASLNTNDWIPHASSSTTIHPEAGRGRHRRCRPGRLGTDRRTGRRRRRPRLRRRKTTAAPRRRSSTWW